MKHITLSLIIITLLLAACASPGSPVAPQATQLPPGPTSAPVETTSAPLETTDPPETAAPEATQPPAETQVAPASGARTYKLVPSESELKYEVGEVFINQSNRFNVAIGVTTQVSGEIVVDLANPQNSFLGPITADISQFTSDSSRRDNALRTRFIESSRYPTVTFVANQISGLPETYQQGQALTLKVDGDLTIREVTKPASFDITLKLEGDTLTGEALTTILMSDFGFGPIDMAGILKSEDLVKVTLSFVARP